MLCRNCELMSKEEWLHKNVLEISNEVFLKEVGILIAEGYDVTLCVRGVSMRPFLEDRRDKIVLTRPGVVKEGDAVLAEINDGKYVFHRVVDIENRQVTLKGDGNVYGTEHCDVENIVASAKLFIRKGRSYSPDGWAWRCYSVLWPKCAMMRRVLLAIHRRLPFKWR